MVDNVQLSKQVYEAFGQGDIASVLATFDPNIEWRLAEGNLYDLEGKGWRGPDAIVQNHFMRYVSEWDEFVIHPKEFHDAGDTVVVECRYTGTFRATGKSIDAQACDVFEIRDGKIIRFQQYTDTAQLQRVAGIR